MSHVCYSSFCAHVLNAPVSHCERLGQNDSADTERENDLNVTDFTECSLLSTGTFAACIPCFHRTRRSLARMH